MQRQTARVPTDADYPHLPAMEWNDGLPAFVAKLIGAAQRATAADVPQYIRDESIDLVLATLADMRRHKKVWKRLGLK